MCFGRSKRTKGLYIKVFRQRQHSVLMTYKMRAGNRNCICKSTHAIDISVMEEVSYLQFKNSPLLKKVKGYQGLGYAQILHKTGI